MAEANFQVEHVMTGIPRLKCLQCISEAQIAVRNDQPVNPIEDAITLAPSWVSKAMMGQMIFAAVAVPCCMKHLQTEEKSPQQRAVEGGIILGSDGAMGGGG